MNVELVLPNRDCGACQVCCVIPDINEPELVKPAGAACKHLCGSGCSIQETKPAACRAFQCAWRLLPESAAAEVFRSLQLEGYRIKLPKTYPNVP